MIRVAAVHVGQVRTFSGDGEEAWTSAIIKEEVQGPRWVDATHVAGDEQASVKFHGGPDKAVLGYAAENYQKWQQTYPEREFGFGGFGENLTLTGVDESNCAIGDEYACGGLRLQVSQPRQPCWKLSRRWKLPDLAKLTQETGRTGWYFRVLREGFVESGMSLELVARPYPELTIAWANGVMYANPKRKDDDARLAACPALADAWQQILAKRLS